MLVDAKGTAVLINTESVLTYRAKLLECERAKSMILFAKSVSSYVLPII